MYSMVLMAALSGSTFAQMKKQQRNVTVNGQSGTAEVIDRDGRLFVDMSALASIGKGSVNFSGPGIVLTFPGLGSRAVAEDIAEPTSAPSRPPNSSALSQEFMKASIEEIARLREWATTLASAIRGGYGVTDEWENGYRDQAFFKLKILGLHETKHALVG